ncbi:Gldg family protein [Verrucomicrobiaceae bacterium N1E253]|uniref:Gldg family protein n=1 Tax=Oceaniferula marina TaxID=2748318 RepID=A0A851GAW0_9BACT|nr:GldG family protein [Oceaniferula marina]NWK54102.1 Gldg family protein [Oceaniferula marina]
MSTKVTHPNRRAILGIIAVILIVIFANWLMSSTSLGNRNLDLTEDKRHTLTEGTKAILSELDTPVIIRYYATRKSEMMPRQLKNYMRKVDDLLNRYRNLSKGQIIIEHLDPQPDTDAEDSANLDGISGQRINDENLYFGLSISSLNQKSAIPYLDPNDETMLEYHLSSAIANVTSFKKTRVGLMTTLPMAGSPAQMPGQQPQQPWIMYQLLEQRYELQNLGMTPADLNPEDTPVILLVHPAGITPETEYTLDQYLLKGGIIIACIDPYAITAPQGNPMMGAMGGGGVPKSSHLPTLLQAWGIGMDSTHVIADGKYASDFGENRRMYAHLNLSQEAITDKDEITTRNFESLYLPLAGGLTLNENKGLNVETLVKSSNEVILVTAQSAGNPDPGLFTRSQPTGKSYGLLMRLQGSFPSAFPDGKPGNEQSADTKAEAEGDKTLAENASSGLKKAEKPGTVYLISDADFLFDVACFQSSPQGHIAVNNNAALIENILDQCTGSKHLIGARSRAATMRPFTVVKEMETQFAKELREDVEKAQQEMQDIVTQLQQLQSQKSQGKQLVLSPEQELKIIELQEKEIQLRRELRDKQKSLRSRKDALYAKITRLTVAVTPAFVALLGLAVWLIRRKTTRAL